MVPGTLQGKSKGLQHHQEGSERPYLREEAETVPALTPGLYQQDSALEVPGLIWAGGGVGETQREEEHQLDLEQREAVLRYPEADEEEALYLRSRGGASDEGEYQENQGLLLASHQGVCGIEDQDILAALEVLGRVAGGGEL